MSQIFEALTIAHDRAVEKLVDRQVDADETITVAPERFVFTHQKIRNGLIVAFFVVGLTLLATNYAFKGNALVAKSQPIYGVAFESTVHPASEFGITADLSGTVSSISVKVGDKVQQGQSLLHMDGREAELALKQAGGELRAAEANLEEFNAHADADARVAESQRREQHIPSRQFRDSPERAKAAYDLALSNYNRAKALNDAGVMSKQELDGKETELRIAQDDLENAKKLAAASSTLEQEQATQVDSQAAVARERLEQQLNQARLTYERAKEQAEARMVRTTQAGVVSEIPVHLGDRVTAGTILVRLAELDHMIAEVPVAARMIAELKVGQPAQVILPSSPPQQVEGKVRLINPLPSANMTHIVEVEFDNPTLLLLAGQSAEVRFSKR